MLVASRAIQIPTAEAYTPLLERSRYKGLHGGRGSGKSHEFANLLIERAMMRSGLRWVCVREIQKSLDQSVKQLLEDKIKLYELQDYFRILHTHIETPGDGIFLFQGMQDHTATSIKSLEGFDGAWVEEAQTLSATSLTMLRPTIRKEYCIHCRTKKEDIKDFEKNPPCDKNNSQPHDIEESEIWFSWNPRNDDDPVDDFLRKNRPPNAIVIGTTFRDNPWFPDVLRKELEWDRKTDHEKYLYVWEGGYERRTQSRVFKNWRVEEFVAPSNAQFYVGCDWGYSVDPATMVRCYEERNDPVTGKEHPRKRLYIDYERYKIGVEIEDLPAFFDGLVCGCPVPEPGQPKPTCKFPTLHGWARNKRSVADSSRPDTISHLRRHGYRMMEPSKKGKNSVKEGVLFLQGYEIIIHPRCVETKREYEHYSFVVDKQTNYVTNELEDKKNHIIDPTRYALEQLRGQLVIREALWG